jgi:TolB-like protein/DNA-binding winged helix-turn-helix (wHTH) protein/Tfp pilus assembly protein PilF
MVESCKLGNYDLKDYMELIGNPPMLKFGPYLVDLGAGELRKHGARIRLQEKPLRVLALLAERQGQVVTREELKKHLWPENTFVDFETGLNTAVSKLRDALSDTAERPRFIETIPRRGYRFLAQVERIEGKNDGRARAPAPRVPIGETAAVRDSVVDAAAHPQETRGISRKFRGRLAVALLMLCLVVTTAAFFGVRQFFPRVTPAPTRAMLVVLPFENLTGDPEQEYVSDGFTEEIIMQLGELNHDQMGVIARTSAMSYKESQKPINEIARELGVDYALEGSIRKTSEGLVVTAQLIRADNQTHIWAHKYTRPAGDLAELQGEVAEAIAREIQIQLTPQAQLALLNARPVKPDAYLSYLKGRYNLNMRSGDGMGDAVGAFREAIQEDPDYAPAYSGLADSYNMLIFYGYLPERNGIAKARAAAEKAAALDADLAESHASLGYVYFMWDLNWAAAEREFKRAIELDGNYSPAHHWYALLLAALGRREASLTQIKQAEELDPLSLIVTTASAYISYFAGDYDRAAALCAKALQRDPNFMVAHTVLGLVHEQQGHPEIAIAEFQKTLEISGRRQAAYLDYLGHAYAAAGQREKAEAVLAELRGQVQPGGTSPISQAATLLALGEEGPAMDAMEEGFAKSTAETVWLKVDPRYENLHRDPRYQRLLRLDNFIQ